MGICWCYALMLLRAPFLSDNAAFRQAEFLQVVVE